MNMKIGKIIPILLMFLMIGSFVSSQNYVYVAGDDTEFTKYNYNHTVFIEKREIDTGNLVWRNEFDKSYLSSNLGIDEVGTGTNEDGFDLKDIIPLEDGKVIVWVGAQDTDGGNDGIVILDSNGEKIIDREIEVKEDLDATDDRCSHLVDVQADTEHIWTWESEELAGDYTYTFDKILVKYDLECFLDPSVNKELCIEQDGENMGEYKTIYSSDIDPYGNFIYMWDYTVCASGSCTDHGVFWHKRDKDDYNSILEDYQVDENLSKYFSYYKAFWDADNKYKVVVEQTEDANTDFRPLVPPHILWENESSWILNSKLLGVNGSPNSYFLIDDSTEGYLFTRPSGLASSEESPKVLRRNEFFNNDNIVVEFEAPYVQEWESSNAEEDRSLALEKIDNSYLLSRWNLASTRDYVVNLSYQFNNVRSDYQPDYEYQYIKTLESFHLSGKQVDITYPIDGYEYGSEFDAPDSIEFIPSFDEENVTEQLAVNLIIEDESGNKIVEASSQLLSENGLELNDRGYTGAESCIEESLNGDVLTVDCMGRNIEITNWEELTNLYREDVNAIQLFFDDLDYGSYNISVEVLNEGINLYSEDSVSVTKGEGEIFYKSWDEHYSNVDSSAEFGEKYFYSFEEEPKLYSNNPRFSFLAKSYLCPDNNCRDSSELQEIAPNFNMTIDGSSPQIFDVVGFQADESRYSPLVRGFNLDEGFYDESSVHNVSVEYDGEYYQGSKNFTLEYIKKADITMENPDTNVLYENLENISFYGNIYATFSRTPYLYIDGEKTNGGNAQTPPSEIVHRMGHPKEEEYSRYNFEVPSSLDEGEYNVSFKISQGGDTYSTETRRIKYDTNYLDTNISLEANQDESRKYDFEVDLESNYTGSLRVIDTVTGENLYSSRYNSPPDEVVSFSRELEYGIHKIRAYYYETDGWRVSSNIEEIDLQRPYTLYETHPNSTEVISQFPQTFNSRIRVDNKFEYELIVEGSSMGVYGKTNWSGGDTESDAWDFDITVTEKMLNNVEYSENDSELEYWYKIREWYEEETEYPTFTTTKWKSNEYETQHFYPSMEDKAQEQFWENTKIEEEEEEVEGIDYTIGNISIGNYSEMIGTNFQGYYELFSDSFPDLLKYLIVSVIAISVMISMSQMGSWGSWQGGIVGMIVVFMIGVLFEWFPTWVALLVTIIGGFIVMRSVVSTWVR